MGAGAIYSTTGVAEKNTAGADARNFTAGSGDEITAGAGAVDSKTGATGWITAGAGEDVLHHWRWWGASVSPDLTTHQKLSQRQTETLLDLCVGNLEPKWPRSVVVVAVFVVVVVVVAVVVFAFA